MERLAPEGPALPRLNLGVGDVLQLSVFESSTGGLFQPSDTQRPANFVQFPSQVVDQSGYITVPYAGRIRIAGRSVSAVERDIEDKISGRAIEPQVLLSVVEQNAATVSVLGDTLNQADKFRISPKGDRILDIISRAQGTRFPGYELFVTLQRRGERATVHFPRLVRDPGENIFVRPGDTIYVHRIQEKFVAFGALGSTGQTEGLTGQFPFEQERLSLNEALAKAGGLQDSRANPAQVFIYRPESRKVLEKMGIALDAIDPDQKWIPTVYRVNFRDPSGFFAAHVFQIRDRDVIYAANSDATEVVKFLDYTRAVTSTVAGAAGDYALTRDVLIGRHILE